MRLTVGGTQLTTATTQLCDVKLEFTKRRDFTATFCDMRFYVIVLRPDNLARNRDNVRSRSF